MSNRNPPDIHPRSDDRLARCALAADRAGKAGRCPDDDAFARFVEAGAADPGQQALLEHISTCEDCCRKWLIMSAALESAGEPKTSARSRTRRLLAAAGSVCAVAVGVMLYLSIDYQPVLKTETDRSPGTVAVVGLQSSDQRADAEGSANDAGSPPSGPVLQEREYLAERQTRESKRTAGAMMAEDQAVGGLREAAPEPSPVQPQSADTTVAREKNQEAASKMAVIEKEFRTQADGVSSAPGPEVIQADPLARFVEQFVAGCRDDRPDGMKPEAVQNLIEQGRALLGSGILAVDEQAEVDGMLGALGLLPEVDRSRFEEVCARAAEFGRTRGYDINTDNTR